MMIKSTMLLAALLGAATTTSAYEIGCIYPPTMPNPMEARNHLHQYSGSYLMQQKTETPIVIHAASFSSLCQIGCLSYHDDAVLSAITKQRPPVTIPNEYHNSWSRMLCMAQCFEIVAHEVGKPDLYLPFWQKWGLLHMAGPRRHELSALVWLAQDGIVQPLQDKLQEEEYHPFTVGHVVATELLLYIIDDGWNAPGNWTYDSETGQPVECTANCERYKDTTGYFPKNHPTGKRENSTTKYIVEGVDKYWQPLVDNDEQGFFSAQEHVVPHVGFRAKTKLYDSVEDFPQALDPQYDYYNESLLVIERLKVAAGDPMMKQKIEFFDNKLLVLNNIEVEVKKQFGDHFSFEHEVLYIEGLSAGEYEAVLMAWREKVRHDLVRPTTVIKRWGNDILETFTGDKTKDGPGEIRARDFHAFQRVMPHSEYPSGSSCICTAYTEFTDAFTMGYYNGTVKDLPFGSAGEGEGYGCNPELDPPLFTSVGCDHDFVIPDMKTMLYECGQSRLWAGFHFTAAVTEGEKLCAGVGLKTFDHVQQIRNASSLGQQYFPGDPHPTCSNPENVVTSFDQTSENGKSAGSRWALVGVKSLLSITFISYFLA